jgi:hypothetical protein
MIKRARFTLAVALGLTVASSASALGGPLKGKTYEGTTPTTGVTQEGHHRVLLRAGGKIILRVSRNGRSVTVRFSSSSPVLYCRTAQALQVQATKAAAISSSGSFRASISQRFKAGPGAPAIVQLITGRFSGHTLRGTIKTVAEPCSGSASFTATAH